MQATNNHDIATVNPEAPASALSTAGLPSAFVAMENGISEINDATAPSWLCAPLTVSAVFRDALGSGRGRLIEFIDEEGVRRTLSVFDRDLETSFAKVRSLLADRGFRLASGKKAQQSFSVLLREWQTNVILTSVDQSGWADSSCRGFVLPDGRVLGKGQFRYTGAEAGVTSGKHRSRGTWQEWRDDVASKCPGNPLLVMSVSSAFSGPLLQLLDQQSGGLHLHGNSSCGKSTIVQVGASVWGPPSKMGSWRATANGLESAASAANSTLLTLDEMAEVSGRDLGAAIYMLGNDTGKQRSSSNGAGITPAEWRLAILSSGEITVAEKLAESRRKLMAGQAVRLIDIEADARLHGAFDDLHGSSSGAEFSNRLKEAVSRCHGTAGPEFARRLANRPVSYEQQIRRLVKSVERELLSRVPSGDDGQVRRVVRRFAVIAVAGELATNTGLTGWQPRVAIGAAAEVLEGWLDNFRSQAARQRKDPVAATRDFLKANVAGFADLDADSGEIPPGRCGWRDGRCFYVLPETWETLHGRERFNAARELTKASLLDTGDGKHLQIKMSRRAGRTRAYAIRASILGDPLPAEVPAAA